MSAAYTLHVPRDATPGDPAALDRADLVRDGFAWGALVSPTLWFFWHRHWVLGLAALAVGAALVFGLLAAGAGLGTVLTVDFLLHVLFGLEGPSLRRFGYARRGRPAADVVVAANSADAEAKAFTRWLAKAEAPVRTIATAPTYRRVEEPVIGLFPDLEGRRP